jgi:CheY-like chemotaxis protein
MLSASDGASAVQQRESLGKLHLLITEVGLPGLLNGWQLADLAQIWYPSLRALFITSYVENAPVESKRLPHIRELNKPFLLETLLLEVRRMLTRDDTSSE